MNVVLAACLSFVMLVFYLSLAVRPVSVDVNPHVAFAPAFVRVTVRVQPNAENRGLYVEADGGEYRSSFVQMEGENSPVIFQVEWPSVGAGDYEVRASVSNSVKVTAVDRTQLKVIGRDQ